MTSIVVQEQLSNASVLALFVPEDKVSIQPKLLSLVPGQPVDLCRISAKQARSTNFNGYFEEKVLSRRHAKIWSEKEDTEYQVYIQDIGSANGTFVDGERLAPDGQTSEPRRLFSESVIDFGVNIFDEADEQHGTR